MFTAKKQSLQDKTSESKSIKTSVMVTDNPFLLEGLKLSTQTTSLGNGALKYTTTGSDFVDQFGKVTNYRTPRSYEEISKDMKVLWSQNPQLTTAFTFYLRMITREVNLSDGTKTSVPQRGQGLKHEGIFRMIWLQVNHPDVFWKNISLYISVSCWKDIITMLQYDLVYNGWDKKVLDWNNFGKLILSGLENPNTVDLVKKYLPSIKSNSVCKTVEAQADNMIAKWICSLIFGKKEDVRGNYAKYRKLKSSGTAHTWQQLISESKFFQINFNTIHGRALSQLVSSKFLANQGLEDKYEKWISSKPVAKYTGYVYELMQPVKSGYRNNILKTYQIDTINKQFYQLIETAKKGMNTKTSFIVAVDTSSSMTSNVGKLKVSAYDVAKSMALYFSYLLEGKFNKSWLEFNDVTTLKYWKGNTPVENLQNDKSESYGSTDFQSVAKIFVDILKTGVKETDFPTGVLCLSDGCFNSTNNNKSNYKTFKSTLLSGGFSKEFVDNFKIVLWDIPNNYYGTSQTAFEEFANCPNMFHISGLDGSVVSFLNGNEKNNTSAPKTSEELFLNAMNQEVLNLIEI